MTLPREKDIEDKDNISFLQKLDSWHREFDFVTACYMLEPWERKIVKGTLVVLTAVLLFTLIQYLSQQ